LDFKRVFWIAAPLTLLALLVACRLHTFHEVQENDCSLYAVAGGVLLDGGRLYVDVWDHKPPAVYWTFAVFEAVFGRGPLMVFALNLVTVSLAALGIFLAGAALTGKRWAGLVAASLWCVLTCDVGLQANQPNGELFINLCDIWLLLVFLRLRRPGWCWWLLLAGGGLVFWASCFKPIAALVPVLAALALLLAGPDRKTLFLKLLAMAGVAAACWLALCLWYWAAGDFAAFNFAVFEFNRAYAGDMLGNLRSAFLPANLLPACLLPFIPLGLCAAAGVASLLRWRHWSEAGLLLAYALAAFLMAALPGFFYAHYYQYWLPVLALGAAAMAALEPRRAVLGLAAAAGAWTLYYESWTFRAPVDTITKVKYGAYGDVLLDARKTAATLAATLRDDETFYLWGFETNMYFESGKRPPSPVLFHRHLLQEPYVGVMSRKAIDALERNPPELLVVAKHALDSFKPGNPVPLWLSRRYVAFPGYDLNPSFVLFLKQGGRLDNELNRRR